MVFRLYILWGLIFVTGCSTSSNQKAIVLDQAVFDLLCPDSQIEIKETKKGLLGGEYKTQYMAKGCHKKAYYEVSCTGFGHCRANKSNRL